MIRVFVGAAANGEDAEACSVLEYSILKHTAEPVEFVWMMASRDPDSFWSGWNMSAWATPFSAHRWGIPAYCGFQGKAIYTDADVWFQADIAELWNQEFQSGKVVLAKPGSWRFCVSLWDCAAAKPHMLPLHRLKEDPGSHKEMGRIFRNPDLVQPFDGNWNCLDGEKYASLDDPDIKALHYTDMSCAPSARHAMARLAKSGQPHWFDGTVRPHPRPDVTERFDSLLAEAIAHGFKPEYHIPDRPFGDYKKASLTHYRGRA